MGNLADNNHYALTKRNGTVADLMKKEFPKEFAEWEKRPWDYKVFGPMGLEDSLTIHVRLEYSNEMKTHKVFTRDFEIPVMCGFMPDWKELNPKSSWKCDLNNIEVNK